MLVAMLVMHGLDCTDGAVTFLLSFSSWLYFYLGGGGGGGGGGQ